jgi:hypothetical protein
MYADAKLWNNVLRPLFSARHFLCGLPSVTIQTRLKPAFGRFFSLLSPVISVLSRSRAKKENSPAARERSYIWPSASTERQRRLRTSSQRC